uniref:Protein NRT1/ PTR FAMILY 7.2-like n=1 Tax=Tanacetum cinerariifolium TaxID=118510 RepID=A0A699ID52_TANCI|nr:protein NRT1/ PTR FAMILY 7.2-like [Tanacetum cinerariifolium]
MKSFSVSKKVKCMNEEEQGIRTMDGTLDYHGRPALTEKIGRWTAGTILLVNQGLVTLAFSELDDYYWVRYKTCAIFQAIFVLGLGGVLVASSMFLITPKGCGYQPNIATFGADQFDEENVKEGHSKIAFFSYFYLVLNLGSIFSNTILSYFENEGMWTFGFWLSTGLALFGLVLFLCGTIRYRHFKPSGNPLNRFCQVFMAASKKWSVKLPEGKEFMFEDDKESSSTTRRKILNTHEFKFWTKRHTLPQEISMT